jgi:hypothetical protein
LSVCLWSFAWFHFNSLVYLYINFTKGSKREGQEKGVKEGKCLNGKEGVLSADPSAYDEDGKKEIT